MARPVSTDTAHMFAIGICDIGETTCAKATSST